MKPLTRAFVRQLKSFKHAFAGIHFFVRHDYNGGFYFSLSLVLFLLGFMLSITTSEWYWVIGLNCLLWAVEMFNTAIEQICNFVSPQKHHTIKVIKDLCAGAVLLVFAGAMTVHLCIFANYI